MLLKGRSFRRLPMVRWFDPAQLIDTGVKSLASTLIGQRIDRRLIQALSARRTDAFDYTVRYRDADDHIESEPGRFCDEIWLDYIADTGDGWNPTYAIAYAAAQRELRVGLPGSTQSHRTQTGDLLVFGGDLVYPSPSRKEYRERLIVPFTKAYGDAMPASAPHVFAIPGNHDWYDGLEGFTRLFCSDLGGRRFAGWWTRQRRSYFALKLPGRWWLLGSDGQLQSDADAPQIEFFRDIASRHMREGDRVILCLAEPAWIYAHKYDAMGGEYEESDLVHFTRQVFERKGVDVKVFIAGDLHHYRRHEEVAPKDAAAPVQKITAGGGGAFLHPTHDEDTSLLEEISEAEVGRPQAYALKAQYPDARASRRLAWRNLLFPFLNPAFGIVPAALYLLTGWLFGASVGFETPTGILDSLRLTLMAYEKSPGLALWIIAVAAVFIIATDTHSRLYKWLGGLAHAAAHYAALFYVGWGAVYLARQWFPDSTVASFAFMAAAMIAAGWLLGSLIVGVYLLVSLNLFGRHSQEAFSALHVQDYKHFLRLHIDPSGALTVYPIKLERVPRRWRERRPDEVHTTRSLVVPDEALTAELIEPPIHLAPRAASQPAPSCETVQR